MKKWPPVVVQGVIRTLYGDGSVRVDYSTMTATWNKYQSFGPIEDVWIFDCMDMSCNPNLPRRDLRRPRW